MQDNLRTRKLEKSHIWEQKQGIHEDGPWAKMVHNFSKTEVGCGRYTGKDNRYIAGQKDALNNLLIKY